MEKISHKTQLWYFKKKMWKIEKKFTRIIASYPKKIGCENIKIFSYK